MTPNATGSQATSKSGYLPTLDGWRAIAILAVIMFHDGLHTYGIFSTRWLYQYGEFGVDVFFAISGFLICSRMLDEERLFGSISLRRFYIRRLFRILPPALLYLLAIACLSRFSIIFVSIREWLEALLFCRNYSTIFGGALAGKAWYTGHFWSLSLEEQFYLILPGLLVLTKKKYRVAILAILTFLIVIHRALTLHTRPWNHLRFHADIRLDALLLPALLAILASNLKLRGVLQRLLRIWPALVIAILCVIPLGEGTAWGTTVLIILMSLVIVGSVLNPNNLFGKALEWRWLRFIGRISFSLYLWQQLFFNQHFQVEIRTFRWQTWPLNAILTLLCAMGSYYLLERPAARFGHRLAPSATPGREDLDGNSRSEIDQSALQSH